MLIPVLLHHTWMSPLVCSATLVISDGFVLLTRVETKCFVIQHQEIPLSVLETGPFESRLWKEDVLRGDFRGVWLECDDSHWLFPEEITFLRLQVALWTTLPRLRLWYALKVSPSALSHLHNRHSFKETQMRQKVKGGTSGQLEELIFLTRHTGWIVRLRYGIGEQLLVVFPQCSSV